MRPYGDNLALTSGAHKALPIQRNHLELLSAETSGAARESHLLCWMGSLHPPPILGYNFKLWWRLMAMVAINKVGAIQAPYYSNEDKAKDCNQIYMKGMRGSVF